MNPRERLIENIIDIVHATRHTPDDEKLAHLVKLLLATLKTHYAIGRWVPVSERLPEFKGNPPQHWKGLVTSNDKRPLWVTWYTDDDCEEITHWLDLSLPSGKGEA